MRQRAIKPEHLFRNEEFAQLPMSTRFLFVALLCCADREGRFRDNPILILADAFPFEREKLSLEQLEGMLQELYEGGFIVRYSICGKGFVQIADFLKLEKPHVNEVQSIIPAPGVYGTQLKPRLKPVAPVVQATSTNGASHSGGSGSGSFSGSESESESGDASNCRASLGPSFASPHSGRSFDASLSVEENNTRARSEQHAGPENGKNVKPVMDHARRLVEEAKAERARLRKARERGIGLTPKEQESLSHCTDDLPTDGPLNEDSL
jgi:hypothetical protein